MLLPDAIVVGAGIVGAACARELTAAGLRVTVVEAGVVGGGATAAGMGHLAVMDDSEAQFALTSYSQSLWRELAPELFPQLPVAPRKGHLLITDRYPGFVNHQLIELGYLKSAHSTASDSVAFNVQPRRTGQILIGSSRQFGVTETAVESDILGRMLRRAIEYMPGLRTLSAIRTWTGFRAATPDKLPLIGPAPGLRNVLLATGHEGLGISTSLATARLIADELRGRPSLIPREPYEPGRA